MLERFNLDISNVNAQLNMLDKLATYQSSKKAGVPTPRFWEVHSWSEVERHREELVFPLIVKPLHSHAYAAAFPGRSKFRVAHNMDDLKDAYSELTMAGLAIMLVEKIAGPDDLLCSYYTYIDTSGSPTFDFTKRILRRYPPNMGVASYHITDWNPAVRDVAQRLFKHVGLRGVANAEFKLDRRDGQLKIIECNARFTDATPLLAASGIDLARYVYLQVLRRPDPPPQRYVTGRRLLYLSNDVLAYRELRRCGELTLSSYVSSLAHKQTFGYLSPRDPLPALARGVMRIKSVLTGHFFEGRRSSTVEPNRPL
ncbi:carboxylate--amine ligase [Pseudonocardia bannensis]